MSTTEVIGNEKFKKILENFQGRQGGFGRWKS